MNDPLRKHCQDLFDAKRAAWEAARIKRQSTVPSTQEFAGTLETMYNSMAHESAEKIKELEKEAICQG